MKKKQNNRVVMIKHSGGLPEKQIRSSKLVTQSIDTKELTNTKLTTQNVMNSRNRSER